MAALRSAAANPQHIVLPELEGVSLSDVERWISNGENFIGLCSKHPGELCRAEDAIYYARIIYEKKAWQLSPRLVRIRNLVFDRSVTLLNCVDLETGHDRQFRLDRVQSASVMD